MPTLLPALMTTVLHEALDRALPPPPPPPPTALTLTVGGVVFSLTPTDSTAEVSFKQNSNGSIVLSLTNFTGDLQVLAGAPAPTLPPGTHGHHPAAVTTTTTTTAATAATTAMTTPPSANVLVVEEPDSPIAADSDSAAQVTPAGQQKLSFQASKKKMKMKKKKPNTKTSDNANANANENAMATATAKRKKPTQAKRNDSTSSVVVASSTNNDTKKHHQSMFKKSRRGDAPPPLCQQTQTMDTQSSQPNHQYQPELSQTMPSTSTSTSSFGGSTSDVNVNINVKNNVAASATTSASVSATSASVPTLTAVPRESVQEILARVNNSNDSVATVPGDHEDDEEELETGLPATPPPTTTSIRLLQDESDPMELSETPRTTNIVVSPAAAMEEGGVDDQNKLNPTTGGYPAPCPRWGHTMTGLKDGRMLIYGGQSFSLEGDPIILSDVHVYNPLQRQWDKPINCRGEARQWHSATFLPERQLLLAFGGETSMDTGTGAKRKTRVVTSDSLKVLDTEIMLWYPPAVSGDVPTGRSGHTATLVSTTNDLVLFGGVKGSKWLNTLSVLDTTRWIWTTPKVLGAAPKPRSYHSTTAVPGPNGRVKLVIFGGNNKTACFNTVHVLEYLPLSSSTSATTQAAAATTTSWKWSHPSCQGQPPFPRTGHSATLLDDGKTIHFFGGWDPNDDEVENIFKSSFLLDTDTWMWKQGPKALAGGYGTNNSSTTESSLLLQEDCGPKRCGHTASVHPETGEVLVFGGRIPGEVLAGDFQRLVVPQPQPLPNDHHNTATTDGPLPPQEELKE